MLNFIFSILYYLSPYSIFYNNMYNSIGLISVIYITISCFLAVWINSYFHDCCAYGLSAIKLENKKKITKNPLKYIDVPGFLLFITTGYGWGKLSKCDTSRLTKWQKVKIYLSGCIANFVFAVLVIIIQSIILIIALYAGIEDLSVIDVLQTFMNVLARINILMFICNILPIPGFAGYYILKTLFFENANSKWLVKAENNGHTILTILVFSRVLFYAADVPASYLYGLFVSIQETVVDFITGGLYSGWIGK